jgi:hypothetical protein
MIDYAGNSGPAKIQISRDAPVAFSTGRSQAYAGYHVPCQFSERVIFSPEGIGMLAKPRIDSPFHNFYDKGTQIPDQQWSVPSETFACMSQFVADQVDQDGNPKYTSEFGLIVADLTLRLCSELISTYPPQSVQDAVSAAADANQAVADAKVALLAVPAALQATKIKPSPIQPAPVQKVQG